MKDKAFQELRTREAEELLLKEIDAICQKTLPKHRKTNLGSLHSFTCKRKLKFRSTLK